VVGLALGNPFRKEDSVNSKALRAGPTREARRQKEKTLRKLKAAGKKTFGRFVIGRGGGHFYYSLGLTLFSNTRREWDRGRKEVVQKYEEICLRERLFREEGKPISPTLIEGGRGKRALVVGNLNLMQRGGKNNPGKWESFRLRGRPAGFC